MKILQLRFKNINSLAGENEIDFTKPIFTQDGLFAITGKTGAGKSSILDAIALALFGKTPRVEITGTDNAVITRGEKDCYAEVIFEVAGNIWKSSWKQERTRTGTLKPVNRIIANSEGLIVADQVRSCDQKIEEIIGLSFEQFTKVILLAQGSFAAFLQAKQNEKGELLEQITGTAVYAEISKKVFERSKIEKEKLDQILAVLASFKLMSEEEMSSLKQEILMLETQKKLLDEEVLKLEVRKKQLQDVAHLKNQLTELQLNLPILAEQHVHALSEFQKADLAYQQAKEFQIQQQPLFKKVLEFDTKISEGEKVLQPIKLAILELDKQTAIISKTIENEQAAFIELGLLLAQKQEWANRHDTYKLLVNQFAAIEIESGSLQTSLEEWNDLNVKNNILEKDVELKREAAKEAALLFAHSEENLGRKVIALDEKKEEWLSMLNGSDLASLQANKANLLTLGFQLKNWKDLEVQIAHSQIEVSNLGNKLVSYDKQKEVLLSQKNQHKNTLSGLEIQINLLEENIKLTKTIQSLEEHRKGLIDGEACPLCGALEHPFALGNMPHLEEKGLELAELKKHYLAIVNASQEIENLHAKIGSDILNASENKEKEEKKLQEQITHQEKLLNEILLAFSDFEMPMGEGRLDALTAMMDKMRNEILILSDLIKRATDCEAQIINLRDVDMPALQHSLNQALIQKNIAETAQKLIEQQWQENIKLTDLRQEKLLVAQQNLSNKLAVYGVDNMIDLKVCLDQWQDNTLKIEQLIAKINSLEADLAIQKKELENVTNLLSDKQKSQQQTEAEIVALWIARKEIFEEKSVEEAELLLAKQLEACEKLKQNNEKVKHDAHTELEKVKAIIEEKEIALQGLLALQIDEKPLNELEANLKEMKISSGELIQKMGGYQQIVLSNNEQVERSAKKLNERERQEIIYHKWASLNELIGSSDGKKYRNFAQALTFEHLIGLSNKQLQKMSDRYLLKRSGDASNPFELSVIDKFQNAELRTAQNLSGGEKFIVSMSLALGLANMASKNMRIDTMFIDEGFGTLDSDYLDVALSALSNLQSEGKIIGVISHLSELKERIATHIEVVPSGNGHSKINIKNGA